MKGSYGNTGVQISNNFLSPEIPSDISNLGSVSSNWNCRTVKDYDENSSDPKLVLENLRVITDCSLEISTLIPYLTNLTNYN